jgi:hypothetical protein
VGESSVDCGGEKVGKENREVREGNREGSAVKLGMVARLNI